MRTTSSLEAMHSSLGRSFPKNPHVFKFIDRLRLFELSKSVDMLDLVRNNDIDELYKRRQKSDQQRDDKIKFFTNQLQTDPNMTPGLFLDAMANDDILPGTGM